MIQQQFHNTKWMRSMEEGVLCVLHTFYIASIGGGGTTLGETIIIVCNHFFQNAADHFAATHRKEKLHIHGSGWFPSHLWKKPKSSVEKKKGGEGANVPHASVRLGEVPAGA